MNRLINKTAIIFVTDVELNKEIYYEKNSVWKFVTVYRIKQYDNYISYNKSKIGRCETDNAVKLGPTNPILKIYLDIKIKQHKQHKK